MVCWNDFVASTQKDIKNQRVNNLGVKKQLANFPEEINH